MDMKFKALTYGLMHFSVAVTVTFLLTGSVAAALSIGVVEPMVQTVAYTFHEKLWTRIGRKSGDAPSKTPDGPFSHVH